MVENNNKVVYEIWSSKHRPARSDTLL